MDQHVYFQPVEETKKIMWLASTFKFKNSDDP